MSFCPKQLSVGTKQVQVARSGTEGRALAGPAFPSCLEKHERNADFLEAKVSPTFFSTRAKRECITGVTQDPPPIWESSWEMQT